MKDIKYCDIVCFLFNFEVQFDMVIYVIDQVYFFYLQKVLVDENLVCMKVYVVGDVLNSNGSRFFFLYLDMLIYLVSLMIKFVDRMLCFV